MALSQHRAGAPDREASPSHRDVGVARLHVPVISPSTRRAPGQTRTGATTGLIKNCKVGDLVVELGADCVAAGDKFVVEAKEDAGYSVVKALAELDPARKNRGSSVGLFLFSAQTAPQGMDMLTRNGDDVLVVWDAQRIESDVILRAGLSLAKALCVRKQRERDKNESNWDEVDAAVLAVEKEVTRLAKMRTWTESIQSHSGNILEEIRKMTNNLERQIAVLRESTEALRQ